MKNKKLAVLKSVIALLLCISMLAGTTFAWFTDGVRSGKNKIVAGTLDVELEYLTADGSWLPVQEDTNVFEENTLWEPGHTEVVYLRVSNAGSLALKYQLGVNIAAESGSVNVKGEEFLLSDYIEFAAIEDVEAAYADRAAARAAVQNAAILSTGYTKDGQLLPGDPAKYVAFVVYMPETVTNEANYRTSELPPRIELGISLFATQFTHEADSFGDNYDYAAGFPDGDISLSGKTDITTENGMTSAAATITAGAATADVPAGVQVNDGATALELSVNKLPTTGSNITAATNEDLLPVDVHVEGVSATNTTPVKVRLAGLAPIGLNMGNLKLYHVENGTTNPMTRVATEAELTAHNQFFYDPATGDVILSMATFSEITAVANTENAWKGEFDYSWYTNAVATADGEGVTEYTIANADQLAAFGAIVGGMAEGIEQNSFKNQTVKLISDINLGDKESENNPDLIFHPIGYWNNEGTYARKPVEERTTAVSSGLYTFEGTFDGAGHTIANFYHNTWEIKGDHNWYDPIKEQYYRDGMGLFGRVYGGTVKNLTVKNFSSDGEIATTGVIAAYADGATFENIAIFNCNPRVYNIGNGGIVGCVGWYARDPGLKTTFTNITVDNSNKISALWGSYDVACGGIVGQYYPTSGQTSAGTPKNGGIDLVNCHVSAQMDVYNDVCGNYQYYAYRYAGMIIGSIRENTTTVIDGVTKTIPDMTGISATGCTVNYGDWNDYYYCEFEKNSLASYSEDYQFSRVPHSELNFTDSNGNGVVDANERASVTGCKHTHTAEENHQAIYLPFHQLFTGYGWGVNSIGLEKYSGIVTDLRIAEGDQQESVEKFEGKTNVVSLKADKAYTLGTLFAAVDNGVEIVDSAVSVGITDPDETDGIVTAVFNGEPEKWQDKTITFTGSGKVEIIIQDYQFCIPGKMEVTIGEIEEIKLINKFEVAFDHEPETPDYQNHVEDYLYRVGNAPDSAVELSSLFATEEGATIGDVTVSFETIKGNAAGIYNAKESWLEGEIQFSGTGIVKVTIKDDDAYCAPAEIKLDVVNATNVPENGKISGSNVSSVLLGNTTVSTLYLNNGATLYGNGFTIDCTNAPINGTGNVSENYVVGLNNAHLDNVKIVGKVYTEYGAMASSKYNRALIISTGDSTIDNCYLSNTASPIRINNGSLIVKDSTVKGGNFANIDVRSGHLTLDNVTTINQALGNDKAEDGSSVIGLGIVVYYEMVNISATSITVKNGLVQNNNISSNDTFSSDYAKQFVDGMFNTANKDLQYVENNTKWVNTGIILMTKGINVTGAGNKYDVSFMGSTGAVYTVKPTSDSVNKEFVEDSVYTQGVIKPSVAFNHDNEEKGNYIPKQADKNDYCYFDGQVVQISMDEGDTFHYDPFILDVTKLNYLLNYTVTFEGEEVTSGNKIAFNKAGEYTITYSYKDSYNYRLGENGVIETFEVTYVKTDVVVVAVVEPEAEHAKFTFATNSTKTEEILYNNNTYISAKDVTADGTTWGKIIVGDKTINYPIVTANVNRNTSNKECQVFYYVFKNVVSISDADGTVYSEGTGSDGKMPGNLKVVKGNELKVENNVFTSYNDNNLSRTAGKIFCYSSSSQEDTPVAFNGALAYKSPSGLKYGTGTRDYDAAVIVQYQFTDSNNATYYYYVGYKISNPNNGSSGDGEDTTCVTPDTLITLADGKQVRVDSLKGNEQLLVWNMETGKLDSAPIMFVDSDPAAKFEVVHLYFSDGSEVKVIGEHGFWDYDLNRYVYLDRNAVNYLNHTFAKQDGDKLTQVKLTQVTIKTEVTEAWSPVTAGHLCYFVNGMLSMPGGVGGLFNIFDVDPETMTYDYEAMERDLAKYGMFTYEELNAIAPLSRDMFEAAGGAYLKVSIGKGNLTMDELVYMINRYSKFFE